MGRKMATRLIVAGDLSEARYEQEKAKAEKQLAQLPTEAQSAPEIKGLLKDVGTLWGLMPATSRQQFLNAVFKGIYVWDGQIERVDVRKSFKVLFE